MSSKHSRNKSNRPKSSDDGKNKTRRMMKYASSVAYRSTIDAIKKGKIPIVDPLIVEPIYRAYQKSVRGRTRESIDEGIEMDNEKIKKFFTLKKREKVGGKRSNKTRKNVSCKNRK
jgi:hypothetical protein